MLMDGPHPAREFKGICCKPFPKETIAQYR